MAEEERLRGMLVELRDAAAPFAREHLSDENFATTCEYVSPIQQLRNRANAVERRDAEIRRLRKAVAAAAQVSTPA